MVEVGGSFVGHFCGCHKWVTSKTITSKKKFGIKTRPIYPKFSFNYKTYGNLIISPLSQISRAAPLIWHLRLQSQQWNRQNNVWNIFKVSNTKDARMRSITAS